MVWFGCLFGFHFCFLCEWGKRETVGEKERQREKKEKRRTERERKKKLKKTLTHLERDVELGDVVVDELDVVVAHEELGDVELAALGGGAHRCCWF